MSQADSGTRRVHVGVGDRPYDVVIGTHALEAGLGECPRLFEGRRGHVLLAADAGLPEEFVLRVQRALAAAAERVTLTRLHATEADKSFEAVERLQFALASAQHERSDPVVALGGGIAGDVAGFAAAIYRRGVPVVQCPTTLLAMVDASVGGKTGVNLRAGDGRLLKNFVGAFHQPSLVIADIGALASLPDRCFRAGLAECVKHGMIGAGLGHAGLLEWTESNADAVLARDAGALTELVARNVALKAEVVAADERETARDGGRALLNLGHTFGHAIETIAGLSPDRDDPSLAPLQHGEAVALGLVAACACASGLGSLQRDEARRVESLLTRFGLPTRVRGLPPSDEIVRGMMDDKKVLAGKLRLVLPTGPGAAHVVESPETRRVESAIDAIRA